MPLITIPTKTDNGNLTNIEFNQLLEALKDGTRDIKTASVSATNIAATGNVDFTGPVTIGGVSGPFTEHYETRNVAFISKNGGTFGVDGYDGRSLGKSLSSFQDAINNATALGEGIPSYENPLVLLCVDAGIYEEDIVVPDFVSIQAPTARLKLGGINNNQLVMGTSRVNFHRIFRESGTNPMITMNPTSIGSLLDVDHIIDGGSGVAIVGGSDVCSLIDVRVLELTGGGIGVSDLGTVNKHIHIHISSLRMYSSNSIGIQVLNASDVHGYIDDIHSNAQIVSNATAFDIHDGVVRMQVNRVSVNNFYNVVSPGNLNLVGNEFSGTTTGTGNVVTMSPEEFSNVDNTSDLNKPISEATQLALDQKSNLGHVHPYEPEDPAIQTHITDTTGNPHMIDKVDVGLGNVDNTSDLNKPISIATQDALDLKSNTNHQHTQLDQLNIGNTGTGNYSEFDPEGKFALKGTATVWNDVYASMNGPGLYSTAGTVDADWNENLYSFSGGGDITVNNDRLGSNVQMPHSMKLNSIVKLHMHWRQPDNTPRIFQVRWRIQENGAAANNSWNTVNVDTSVNPVFPYVSGVMNQITPLVDIDFTGYNISDIVQFQVTRTDAVAGIILVSFFDLHYEIDTIGSDLEYTK